LYLTAGCDSITWWTKAGQIVLFVCFPHDAHLSNYRGAEH